MDIACGPQRNDLTRDCSEKVKDKFLKRARFWLLTLGTDYILQNQGHHATDISITDCIYKWCCDWNLFGPNKARYAMNDHLNSGQIHLIHISY